MKNSENMPLALKNFKLILIGIGLIVIGFVLLAGGGSNDPTQFNPEMFSARRIIVAPIFLLGGFVFEIYAILKK